jgi:hypothetical protein
MQNSWLKDLATFRNPQSPLTFISYLHTHNRMAEFVNRGSVPTRKEYTDYLTWGVQQVTKKGIEVHYSTEVVEISKGPEDTLQIYTTDSRTGEQKVYFARASSDLIPFHFRFRSYSKFRGYCHLTWRNLSLSSTRDWPFASPSDHSQWQLCILH